MHAHVYLRHREDAGWSGRVLCTVTISFCNFSRCALSELGRFLDRACVQALTIVWYQCHSGPLRAILSRSHLPCRCKCSYAAFLASMNVLGHAFNMMKGRASRNCKEPGDRGTSNTGAHSAEMLVQLYKAVILN